MTNRLKNLIVLTKWDSFRTANWAELLIDPQSTLTQTEALLAITT